MPCPNPSLASRSGTQEGWKAELSRVVGYIPRQFGCSQTVTHQSSNRGQHKATSLITTNTLTAKRLQLSFNAANAAASAQVNLTTSVVFVTPLLLNYLLRFYTTPTVFYKHYFLHQEIEIII